MVLDECQRSHVEAARQEWADMQEVASIHVPVLVGTIDVLVKRVEELERQLEDVAKALEVGK